MLCPAWNQKIRINPRSKMTRDTRGRDKIAVESTGLMVAAAETQLGKVDIAVNSFSDDVLFLLLASKCEKSSGLSKHHHVLV